MKKVNINKFLFYSGTAVLVLSLVLFFSSSALQKVTGKQSDNIENVKTVSTKKTDHDLHDHEKQINPGYPEYTCPMHPEIISDEPGTCPICSMHLVSTDHDHREQNMSDHDNHHDHQKRNEDEIHKHDPEIHEHHDMNEHVNDVHDEPVTEERKTPEGLAEVHITPQRQQLTGVRTEEITIRGMVKEIRTVGIIEADERRTSRVSTRFSGWIREVFVDFEGMYVKKGDPLFTVYSPELVATQEEYLLALRSRMILEKSRFPEVSSSGKSLEDAAYRRLRQWNVAEAEIQRIKRQGEPITNITFYSPADGFITKRNAFPEMRISPDDIVFEITDLSRIWLIADIYEEEIPLIKTGQEADLTLSYYPGETFQGIVAYIYPTLDRQTRTAKVRFDFENEDMKFKPGMFTNARVKIDLGESLSVPGDAVIKTGEREVVFVAKGNGIFQPREIQTGHRAGEYYKVLGGLKEGERVVSSATFLVDSESRLRAAADSFMPVHAHGVQDSAEEPQDIDISFSVVGETPRVGNNRFRVTVTDREGNPVDDAEVNVHLHMPAMPDMGMPYMETEADAIHMSDGVYESEVRLTMGGTWNVRVTVRKPGRSPVRSFSEIYVR